MWSFSLFIWPNGTDSQHVWSHIPLLQCWFVHRQSRNVLTFCVSLCVHVCKWPPLKACCACIVWVVERCGNVLGNMLCSPSPSLCSSKWGVTPACTLWQGAHGGRSRLGVKLQAMQSVQKKHKGGGIHCLYIIAGHSSGKTSDGCPRRRGAEWREQNMRALWC